MKEKSSRPLKSPPKTMAVQIFFWMIIVVSTLGAILLLQPVLNYLFPTNVAFEGGQNPAILNQLPGQSLQQKMLHMTFMPYTGFHHYPNADLTETFHNRPYHFKTNSRGFLTSYEMDPFSSTGFKKKSGDRVVLFTGGSGAYGWGASSNETTISYVLESLLNRRDPGHHWLVVNLAMGAWIAYQEFLALDLYGTEFDPDWIVTYDGRNDMLVPTFHGEGVPNYFFYTGQKRLNNLFEQESGGSWVDRLPLLRYRRLSQRIAEIAQMPRPIVTVEEVNKAVRFYVHSLSRIADLFHDRKLLFVLQATTGYLRDPNIITPGYTQARPQIQSLAKRLPDAQFVDSNAFFLTPYEGDGNFVDDCHLTDQGQATIAEHIAENILSRENMKRRRINRETTAN